MVGLCLPYVGGGQGINLGEDGVAGWGEALRSLPANTHSSWTICAPPDVFEASGGKSTAGLSIGVLPEHIKAQMEKDLQLHVPLRSYRCPNTAEWVRLVLEGDAQAALALSKTLGEYPLTITRSLFEARKSLRLQRQGQTKGRPPGQPGARRLRADGLGEILHANDGLVIAQWYLNLAGDIRSSLALEVPANEYTCQGLELDFAALWGGDLLWSPSTARWRYSKLGGTSWNKVKNPVRRRFIINS